MFYAEVRSLSCRPTPLVAAAAAASRCLCTARAGTTRTRPQNSHLTSTLSFFATMSATSRAGSSLSVRSTFPRLQQSGALVGTRGSKNVGGPVPFRIRRSMDSGPSPAVTCWRADAGRASVRISGEKAETRVLLLLGGSVVRPDAVADFGAETNCPQARA